MVLEYLESGLSASDAVANSISEEIFPSYRQLLAIDKNGNTCIHSGEMSRYLDCDTGSLLCCWRKPFGQCRVPQAMVECFENTEGALGDRLIAAMQILNAGGEAGPLHSAGLLIVDTHAWPYAELRCDWTEDCPILMIAKAEGLSTASQ